MPYRAGAALSISLCLALLADDGARAASVSPGTSALATVGTTDTASLRRTIALQEYHASETALGLQAPNRAHGLRTYFTPEGIRVHDRSSRTDAALLALRLTSLGRGETRRPVAAGEVVSEDNRVEIRREGFAEWYVNTAGGLEQGFDFAVRPKGEGDLWLELEVDDAIAHSHGEAIVLETPTGRRLRYDKLEAFDANERRLASRFELAPEGRVRLVIDDADAAYPITIDPLLTSVNDTQLESDQATAQLGISVASAGDVNGDGYGDVIVGAWRYDAGEADEGAAFVFLGSATGIASANPGTAHAQLESDQASAQLGQSVAGAGDVNGDGYDDVIVGAFFYDAGESNEGAAFVFLGSASGIASGDPGTAHAQLESDQADAQLGVSVASAGDVNGDGYADVIVGAHFYDAGESNEGAAFVFLGSASGIANGDPGSAHAQLESDDPGGWFGYSVAGAGDVNGDGYSDVIVGENEFETAGANDRVALVFLGSAAGIVGTDPGTAHAQLTSAQGEAWFASSLSGVGDVNGDGYSDVIVGAYFYDAGETDEGVAFVYLGSASGIASGDSSTADAQLESNQASARFGSSVSGAGDVNGDGYADVIVSASTYDAGETDEGAAFVFLGSASGIANGNPSTAHAQLESDQATASFGQSVAGAGDVNGDGYADVIVGANLYDAGEVDEGAAFVYLGGGLGMVDGDPSNAAALLEADNAGAGFGYSVAGAGDTNGDGYGDVIVGAPDFDSGSGPIGAAFVFEGGPAGIASSGPASAVRLDPDSTGIDFGHSVDAAGDMNGDGYGDVIVGDSERRRVSIFLGSSSGFSPGQAPWFEFDSDPEWISSRVAGVGDLNGDGYADALTTDSIVCPTIFAAHGLEIFSGGPSGVTHSSLGDISSLHSATGYGDFNGDGYADVVLIGRLNFDAVTVYYGSGTGLSSSSPSILTFTGFDIPLDAAGVGDVNGDGYADLLIGFDEYPANSLSPSGGAFLVLGGPSGIPSGEADTVATLRIDGDQAESLFGANVAGAGDVNGDGYSDVVIAAPAYSDGQAGEGAAFVFRGSASGLIGTGPASAAAVIQTNQAGAGLGTNIVERATLWDGIYFCSGYRVSRGISSAGDVNNDGFGDLIVGSSGYDNGESDEGAAFLFHGNGGETGRTALMRQGDVAAAPPDVGPWGITTDVDHFYVSATAHHPMGRGMVKLEVEACGPGLPFGDAGCITTPSPSWTDTATGVSGSVDLAIDVTGLSVATLYRWHVRTLYAPIGVTQPGVIAPISPAHGPWRRLEGQGEEAAVRINSCGNGIIDGLDICDDGNVVSGDGCDSHCHVEPPWTCNGEPSVCERCGNGIFEGGETCDDGNTFFGDGCTGSTCQLENGWICSGEPTVCDEICGDGLIRGAEDCDDGGMAPGDGCDSACQEEVNTYCSGEPSVCIERATAVPITHWSFDSGFTATSGTHLNDAAINNGDPLFVSTGGAVGGAGYVDFDGDDDLSVDPKTDYDLGTGHISYSFWLRDDGSVLSDRAVAGGATGNNEGGWGAFFATSPNLIGAAAGDGTGRIIQGSDANGTVDPLDGGWHHVAVTMNNAGIYAYTVSVFLDGILEDDLPEDTLNGGITGAVNHALASFYIGGNGDTNRGLVGDLDDVVIFDGLLTPGKVTAIVNGAVIGLNAVEAIASNLIVNGSFEDDPLGPPSTSTLVAWSVDSGDVDVFDGTHGLAPDASGVLATPADGNQLIDLAGQAGASISQPITGLVVGASYHLDFWYEVNNAGLLTSSTADFLWALTGGLSGGSTITAADTTPSLAMVRFEQEFVATATTATLSFAHVSSDFPNQGALLDSVRLIQIAGATCGDGAVGGAEMCDDGGTTPGDGCDATCQEETNWTCNGEPSVCFPCGNGLIEGGEVCDDGNTTPGDRCDAVCQLEPSSGCTGEPSVCFEVFMGQVDPAEPLSTTDDWDISEGNVILPGSSAHSGYDIRDVIGGSFSTSNPGKFIFDDSHPQGYVHPIQWQRPSPIRIGSFHVRVLHGGDPATAANRGISHFRLLAYNDQTSAYDLVLFDLPLDLAPSDQYDPNGVISASLNIMDVVRDVDQLVDTDRWRVEFTQFGGGSSAAPWIIELDGFEVAPTCSDSLVEGSETCDDGGNTPGDGCDADCQLESGWSCGGEPTVCSSVCNDGFIRELETCDDGGSTPGDGCDADCQLESGWSCAGEPTVCSSVCNDGFIRELETCDDGGNTPGDGCDADCQLESGWSCGGEPTVCSSVCSDGFIRNLETCDDGGNTPGDGCDADCQLESGWICSGEPTVCDSVCGDSLIRDLETCDDGAMTGGDGCSNNCHQESGWSCIGEPSVCSEICGDGETRGSEECDDGGTTPGDGCDAFCQVESGWSCTLGNPGLGNPSTCDVCGNGVVLIGAETCDDGNPSAGDGCSSMCETEFDYVCSGEPSICSVLGLFGLTATDLVRIDLDTPSNVTVIGPHGLAAGIVPYALAYEPVADVLVGITTESASPFTNRLVSVDRETGAATVIAVLSDITTGVFEGIAYSESELALLVSRAVPTSTFSDELRTIDLAGAHAPLVSTSPATDNDYLIDAPISGFWSIDSGHDDLGSGYTTTVNLSTGAATLLPFVAFPDLGDMAYSPLRETLYAVSGSGTFYTTPASLPIFTASGTLGGNPVLAVSFALAPAEEIVPQVPSLSPGALLGLVMLLGGVGWLVQSRTRR